MSPREATKIPLKTYLKMIVKHSIMNVLNVHRPDGRPNVFIFSSPRSGSTWLMELVMTQPGFKYCDEPFNLRTPEVRYRSGMTGWHELYTPDAEVHMADYIRRFLDGKPCLAKLKHSVPSYRYYRAVTHRMVFKILHAGKDRIPWFRRSFNARIVYLLRHPVPVSLSRQQYPQIGALLSGNYAGFFTDPQIKLAKNILKGGTKLEKGVLSWCLQNAVPLQHREKEWTVVTYEQMVLDPLPVIRALVHNLELPDVDRLAARLDVPSQTTWQSDRQTKQMFESDGENKNKYLVEKWKKQVGPEQEKKLLGICETFGLDVYRYGDTLPKKNYWLP